MRSKSGLIVLLAVMAMPAFATNNPDPPPEPKQAQSQDQSQQQVQEQSQTASANNEGVSQAVNFRDRLQAPASFAPAIAPTAPCYRSAAGGLSFPGGSVAGGKAILDEDCQLRENIRLGYAIGLVAEARALWCASAGKDVEGCGSLTPPPAAAPAPADPKPVVVVLTGESCGMSRERADRVLERCVGK